MSKLVLNHYIGIAILAICLLSILVILIQKRHVLYSHRHSIQPAVSSFASSFGLIALVLGFALIVVLVLTSILGEFLSEGHAKWVCLGVSLLIYCCIFLSSIVQEAMDDDDNINPAYLSAVRLGVKLSVIIISTFGFLIAVGMALTAHAADIHLDIDTSSFNDSWATYSLQQGIAAISPFLLDMHALFGWEQVPDIKDEFIKQSMSYFTTGMRIIGAWTLFTIVSHIYQPKQTL